jgi:hypothetical protein
MKSLKFYLKKILYNKRRIKELNSLDFGNKKNEIFLVSYPKSGNTWVRILLANILNNNPTNIINLKNVGNFVPDSHIKNQRNNIINLESGFNQFNVKIVKSHDRFNSFYRNKKVIYVTRNAKNVLPSYYYYLSSRRKEEVNISDIYSGKISHSFGSWYNHLRNWIKKANNNILFISYEDLKTNTNMELVKICNFIGLEFNEENINCAVENSSFTNMKKLEEKYGHYNDTRTETGKSTQFVRKGSSKKSDFTFSEKLEKKIDEQQIIINKLLSKIY